MTLRVLVVTNRVSKDAQSLRSRLVGPMRELRLRLTRLVTSAEFDTIVSCGADVVLIDANSVNGQTPGVKLWADELRKDGGKPVAVVVETIGRRGKINLTNVEEWMKTNKRDVGATVVEFPGKVTDPNAVLPEAAVNEPEAPAPNQPPSTAIVIGSWHLEQFPGDPEPRILDVVLAERLGFSRPRDIRKLCERLDKEGKIPGVRKERHVARLESRGNLPPVESEAYYLDEKNALRVIRRCETDKADEVMDEVINVYLAVRKGTLPTPVALSPRDALRQTLAVLDEQDQRIAQLEAHVPEAVDNAVRPLLDTIGVLSDKVHDLEIKTAEPMVQVEAPVDANTMMTLSDLGTLKADFRRFAYSCAVETARYKDQRPRYLTWAYEMVYSKTRGAIEGKAPWGPHLKKRDVFEAERAYLTPALHDIVVREMTSRPFPKSHMKPADWAVAYCADKERDK